MLERLENVLTLLVSLIGTLSVLLGTIAQLMQWAKQPTVSNATVAELEKDIIRLETALQQQQDEIRYLREGQRNP